MDDRFEFDRTTGIILIGTRTWTNSAFDTMMPRVLLPVAHRPLIAYSVSWLHEVGIQRVAVCGNRETQAIHSLLANHAPAGLSIAYHEDPMPRGAAGCLHDAAQVSDGDTFVVVDGTTIPNVDLKQLLRSHRASGAVATVVVNCESRPHGNPGLQIPTGIYVFDRRALDLVPPRGFCDIKEKLIPQLYRSGERVVAYRTSGAIPRVMGFTTYLAVNEWVVEHLVAHVDEPEGYLRRGSALLHQDALVATDAVLVGPVLVGAGARIDSGAVIVGPTTIGRDVIIGPEVLVSRSAVWRRSTVGAQAQVDRSILADDTFLAHNEQAFQVVKVGSERQRLDGAAMAPGSVAGFERSSLELQRKLGRVLLGPAWSRFPAAQ